MSRLVLCPFGTSHYEVQLDGRAIGIIAKLTNPIDRVRYWLTYESREGPALRKYPGTMTGKVRAIRSLVLRDAAFRERLAA